MNIINSVSLYFQRGSSDKFYTISLIESNGSYSVPFTYGRRSTSGVSGTKLTDVDLPKASILYNKIVREKVAKGYSEGPAWMAPKGAAPVAAAPAAAPVAPRASTTPDPADLGVVCQLLDEIKSDTEVLALINDTNMCAQEKHDGRRRLMRKEVDKISGFNKKGKTSNFIVAFKEELNNIAELNVVESFLIDGEEVGDQYYVFDILELDGEDLRGKAYQYRYEMLCQLMSSIKLEHINLVSTAFTTAEKKDLIVRLKREGKEGIVFKNLWEFFKPGHGTGDQFKFKFYATASCLVTRINTKRSVGISVYESGTLVEVGNCTIPPNKDIPEADSVVEIKYLYAYKGGSLYQPSYLGVRDDVDADECTEDQLKYKAAA